MPYLKKKKKKKKKKKEFFVEVSYTMWQVINTINIQRLL